MSRNRTLREVADRLPPMNKVDRNGKFHFDRHGRPIKVDHFQEMIKLKGDLANSIRNNLKLSRTEKRTRMRDLELKVIGNYSLGVEKAHAIMKRKKRVRIYKIVLTLISLISLAIYIYKKYF